MAIYALGDRTPTIDPTAFVHPDAVIIGDVRIGAESTVWPSAVLRGDYGTIIVGERTSIQDGTVVHAVAEFPTVVGNDCVIGHLAHLEGCTIHDGALVGSGSIVLHHAHVHTGATVAAGAVVRNRMVVPEDALAVGVPAVIKEGASDRSAIAHGAALYVANGQRYARELKTL
ncbi:MAG TPA: gamma carbonic anhydrase family protein [Acidimicrobiales bacterium]|nr:MAG: gamma carbonic anhydrase family protein [Actinobacteria bacterium 21-64-8]HQT99637.1 gamma carbonic anhydrase family protein [Acidimicrobiales bacterium]